MEEFGTVPDARDEIVEIIGPLSAYVHAHAAQRADAQDVIQETLARLLDLGGRLAPGSALAYGIVVARHLLVDQARATQQSRRLGERVIDLTDTARPVLPESQVLLLEERAALVSALAGVPEEGRRALLAHVLDEEPVAVLAEQSASSSGSVGALLARTRARVRVDYVIALRGVDLPTPRCRPVLLALSAADTRRQNALRAGAHLLACPTCADLSRPLLARRSVLAGILPWLGLGPLIGWLRWILRQGSAHATAVSTAAGTAVVATTVGGVLVNGNTTNPVTAAPIPTPSASPTPAVAGKGQLIRLQDGMLLLPAPTDLASMNDDRVSARAVRVSTVPANEGFWIGTTTQSRVWVQILTGGKESPVHIQAGDTVSFTGTIHTQGPHFARQVGVNRAEDAALLSRENAHIDVTSKDLHVDTR